MTVKKYGIKAIIVMGLLIGPIPGFASDDPKDPPKKEGVKLEGRIQTRYTWQENDAPKKNASAFSLPRVRFGAGGQALDHVTYKLEIDVVPSSTVDKATGDVSGGTSISLKDAKISLTRFEHTPITVGHFKAPFSRQELTSSSKQQFVNRAEINKEAPGRDVGLMVGDTVGEKRFEYAISAFNGTKTANKNDNTGFLIAARVAVNPFGPFKYSESNLEGDLWNASIGLSAQTNTATKAGADKKLLTADDTDTTDTTSTTYGVDLGIKFLKRASLFAEYIQATYEPDGATEFDANGGYLQAGYFVLPQRFEVVARYEQYDPDDSVSNTSDIQWTTAGLNLFLNKHDAKVQANYILKNEDGDQDDDTFLLQLQVKF